LPPRGWYLKPGRVSRPTAFQTSLVWDFILESVEKNAPSLMVVFGLSFWACAVSARIRERAAATQIERITDPLTAITTRPPLKNPALPSSPRAAPVYRASERFVNLWAGW